MHILKSFKYVYDPFQVSLWALLIIIMAFHLLFILLFCLLFCLYLIMKSRSFRYWPSKTYTLSIHLTSHRKGNILYSSFDFEWNFYDLLSKQNFTRGMYRTSNSLNKNFPDFFRIKSSLRVYLVGQSRPYRAPFLGLLVVWLRFAYFLEFLPDGWNILFELFCYVTPIKFTTFYQNK